jgi:hypothetical protein
MEMLNDWPRVKAVFEQTLGVEERDRPAFLTAACGDDAQLREPGSASTRCWRRTPPTSRSSKPVRPRCSSCVARVKT